MIRALFLALLPTFALAQTSQTQTVPFTGSVTITVPVGPTGPQGAVGATGKTGAQGAQGPTGAAGASPSAASVAAVLKADPAFVAAVAAALGTPVVTPPPIVVPPPANASWTGVVLDANGVGSARFPISNNWDNATTEAQGTAADGKPALLVTSTAQGANWIPFSTPITDGSVPGNGIGVNLTGFTKLQADIVPSVDGLQLTTLFYGTGAATYVPNSSGDALLGGEVSSVPVTLPKGVATTVTWSLAAGGWNTGVLGYPYLYKFITVQRGVNGTVIYGLRNVKFIP